MTACYPKAGYGRVLVCLCCREHVQTRIGSFDILPRTRTKSGERGFHYSGPAAWNTLPSDLHDITDTDAFKKRLKTVLFDRAYWLIIVVVRCSWTVRSGAVQISHCICICRKVTTWLSDDVCTRTNQSFSGGSKETDCCASSYRKLSLMEASFTSHPLL